MGRLHLLGELAADRPRLGMGLVEEDAGDLRLRGHARLSSCVHLL